MLLPFSFSLLSGVQGYPQVCIYEKSRVVVSTMQHVFPEHRFTPAETLLDPSLIRTELISSGTSAESCP
jgi:hypothetical protein